MHLSSQENIDVVQGKQHAVNKICERQNFPVIDGARHAHKKLVRQTKPSRMPYTIYILQCGIVVGVSVCQCTSSYHMVPI